ncbi:MAG: hypothetical protein HOY79_44945 [Streptomyces sp.]|nr:hypothetical protein [Streptomyces sp.]
MTDKIYAPWTPEQVEALNRFQQYGGMHPFTCGNDHSSMNVVLMAHQDGWHCSAPACHYRQDWAHAFMADPEAWPKGLPFASVINPQTGLGMATGGNMSRTNLLEAALAAQLGRPLYDTINQHLADGQRAEAAIARVRALAERLNDELASDADKTYARAILTALEQPAPTAAPQASGERCSARLAWTGSAKEALLKVEQQQWADAAGLSRADEDEAADVYEEMLRRVESSGPRRPATVPSVDRPTPEEQARLAARIARQPAERCGHLSPQLFTNPPTECVLRPGHSGTHANDSGGRWWINPTAELAGQRRMIADALREHGMVHLGDQVPANEYDCCADAVLAVLNPRPTDA